MIIGGSILAINLTHRLTDRLTEADADSHRIVGSGHTGHELQTALQFLAKGDVPNFKAVWRARRDFKAWKHGFDDDRSLNLRLSTPDSIPERCNASLVVNYYLRHRRTFSQIFR